MLRVSLIMGLKLISFRIVIAFSKFQSSRFHLSKRSRDRFFFHRFSITLGVLTNSGSICLDDENSILLRTTTLLVTIIQ